MSAKDDRIAELEDALRQQGELLHVSQAEIRRLRANPPETMKGMHQFTCSCQWMYVVTKKWVFGPIWLDDDSQINSATHVMPYQEFEEQYADCANNFKNHHK